MKSSTLKKIFRYFHRFGMRTGLQAIRLYLPSRNPIAIRLPTIAHPLWARPGTSDVETFEEVFISKEYDLPFSSFEPGNILDLGANVGYTSVYFAARWPQARILAVEPSKQNLEILLRNVLPWKRISLLNAAVWSHATTMQIANPSARANAFQMREADVAMSETIQAITIHQCLQKMGGQKLDLLKIDIEGAELEILKRDASWLDQVDVLMIELHDRLIPGCAMALGNALRDRVYRQEIVGSNLAFDFRRPNSH